MLSARRSFSGFPCGNRFKCETLAATKSIALAFLHAATQAPQPMHCAASIAKSASDFGTGMELASGAAPVRTVIKPPACWIRSKLLRSQTRSLMSGNAFARNGSTTISSPCLKLRM